MPYPDDASFYKAWHPLVRRGKKNRHTQYRPLQETTVHSCQELDLIYRFLSGKRLTEEDKWFYRVSPSLITRGEAEMLGLSDPRFAKRVLIFDSDQRCLGFSNLRRMRRLSDQIDHSGLLLHKASSIADSILRVPDNLGPDEWSVVSLPAEVLNHCGESLIQNEGLNSRFVPFMKHVDLVGGGLCAQASCFMATMLTYTWAKLVVSIPEISYLGVKPKGTQFRLTGLSLPETLTFLSSTEIGLNGLIQTVEPMRSKVATHSEWKRLLQAIKAYIDSHCPILCAVDEGRMRGRNSPTCQVHAHNVYLDNGLDVLSHTRDAFHDLKHMVILLGHERKGSRLLFQDPAHAPFLRMDVSCLFHNSCYTFPWGNKLDPPRIIPVTPAKVTLPLLDWIRVDASHAVCSGLFNIQSHFRFEHHFKRIQIPTYPTPVTSQYFLLQISELDNPHRWSAAQGIPISFSPQLSKLRSALGGCGWQGKHWIWLQTCIDFIFVWDAESDPLTWNKEAENCDDFLVAVGANTPDGFLWSYGNAKTKVAAPPPKDQADSGREPPTEVSIKPGILTSVSSEGISRLATCLNGAPATLDLYCFMASDSPHILGECNLLAQSLGSTVVRVARNLLHFAYNLAHLIVIDRSRKPKIQRRDIPIEPFIRPQSNVCSWLASKVADAHYIQTVADAIRSTIGPERPCFAASTFFPGITADDPKVRVEAIKALQCVLKIITAFNSTSTDKIRAIKIVCGGLIGSRHVVKGLEGGEKANFLTAKLTAKPEAIRRITVALSAISPHIPEETSIALQLEPGPLFAISSWKDLQDLAAALEIANCSPPKFGFNCDIAHWSLAGINHSDILRDFYDGGPISRRIVHAHISDFGKGHFDDLYPTCVHDIEYFQAWLNTFKLVVGVTQPNNSAHVSLELEVPESPAVLSKAFQITTQLCGVSSVVQKYPPIC